MFYVWQLRFARFLRSNILIVAILGLGLFLRVWALGAESIWRDEMTSIQLAHSTLSQIIADRSQNVNPPFYFVILHYWVYLVGDSEFSVRLLSTLFGVSAILMIYKTASAIFDEKSGILCSLLIAISVFHINYSQEARSYSLMSLLALASMYFFIKLLNKTSFILVFGYIIFSILLMYTHFYGLLIIVVQNIYFLSIITLFKETKFELNFKYWFLSQGVLLILYVPWIGVLINQVLAIQAGYWIPKPNIYSIAESFLDYSSGSKVLLLCFLVFSVFSALPYRKEKSQSNQKKSLAFVGNYSWNIILLSTREVYLLLLWLIIPILLPFIISQFSTPIYFTRYTIAASLAFYILVAKGIQNINNKYVRSFIIILIVVFCLGSINKYYLKITKEQYREIANYVDQKANPGDIILFNPGDTSTFNYYSKRTDLIEKPFDLDTSLIPTETSKFVETKGVNNLEPTVKGFNRVWLIQLADIDKEELLKNELNRLYNSSHYYKFVGLELYFFESAKKENK